MRRLCVLLLLAAFTQACTKWSVAQVGPTLSGEPRVRVTTPAYRIKLSRPVVSGDTLRERSGVRVPMAQIRKAEVRRSDPVATTIIVAGAMGLIVASIVAVSSSDHRTDGPPVRLGPW